MRPPQRQRPRPPPGCPGAAPPPRPRPGLGVVAAALAAVALLAPSRAAAIEDLFSPRSVALGTSLRGYATGTLGPLLNPSGMSLTRSYVVDAFYGLRFQDLGNSLNLSISDSVTSRVAAGVFYSYVHSSPRFAYGDPAGPTDQVSREGHQTGLALSIPIGDRFTFGLTSKYVNVSTTVANPAYDPNRSAASQMGVPQRLTLDSSTAGASADGFTMDAGITLRLGEALSIGVVGQNLVPLRSVEAPMQLGMGLAYQLAQTFTLAADVVVFFDRDRAPGRIVDGQYVLGDTVTSVRVGGGAEYVASGKVPIRLGFVWDGGLPGTWLTAGLGWAAPSFAIDLTYRQKVSAGSDSQLLLGIRLFLE